MRRCSYSDMFIGSASAHMSSAAQVASCRREVVVAIIFHLVHAPNSWKGNLARCARVNKFFFHLAVKTLWEDIEDWNPLYYVLHKSYGKRRGYQVRALNTFTFPLSAD